VALGAILIDAFAEAALGAEAKPDLVGSFMDWHVYSAGAGANHMCYALSEPKQTVPGGLRRDKPFFLISSWPGRRVANEPSVVPGFQYRAGTKVELQIGGDKFQFFTKNDGGTGGAWMEVPEDEKKLIDTMKRGSNMTITGTSARGTLVKDSFSLSGISTALAKVADACK
jgi:hypothetical protein